MASERRRFDVPVPEDWDSLTREQKLAVARKMATEIQRQTGRRPDDARRGKG